MSMSITTARTAVTIVPMALMQCYMSLHTVSCLIGHIRLDERYRTLLRGRIVGTSAKSSKLALLALEIDDIHAESFKS